MSNLFDRFARPSGSYLLNHSVGVPPTSVQDQTALLVAQWMGKPQDAWPQWITELDGFHAELGTLLNHDSKWFCHQVNVSSAVTKIIHSLPIDRGRREILYSERTFPSLGYVAQAAAAAGYQTTVLPAYLDTTNPEVWLDALTAKVGIVLVGHAESNTGRQLPVAEIAEIARQSGAVSVIDVAQSAGILPIDLRAWRADFVVGTSVKWLCGGPGAAFLWVAPDIINRCLPIDVGWFSHEDPFEFDIHEFRFAPDARRFLGGTPSPLPAAVARHSLAAISEVGLGAIHEHNRALTQRLIDAVDDRTLASPRDVQSRSGTVVIDPGTGVRNRVLNRLASAKVLVDERSEGIRVSPHLVNNTDDIDEVIEVLRQTECR